MFYFCSRLRAPLFSFFRSDTTNNARLPTDCLWFCYFGKPSTRLSLRYETAQLARLSTDDWSIRCTRITNQVRIFWKSETYAKPN